MKLLFDENISFRIVKKLQSFFDDCSHIKNHNLMEQPDFDDWSFAKQNNYVIVTNDSDFNDISILKGFPPKIIWLRIGNTSTDFIASLLITKKEQIIEFVKNTESGIFIIA